DEGCNLADIDAMRVFVRPVIVEFAIFDHNCYRLEVAGDDAVVEVIEVTAANDDGFGLSLGSGVNSAIGAGCGVTPMQSAVFARQRGVPEEHKSGSLEIAVGRQLNVPLQSGVCRLNSYLAASDGVRLSVDIIIARTHENGVSGDGGSG